MKTEILLTLVSLASLCSAQTYVEYYSSSCSGAVYSTTTLGVCSNLGGALQFSQEFECNANNTFSIVTYDAPNCANTFFAPTAITYPSNTCIYMSGPPTTNETIYGIAYCNSAAASTASSGASSSTAQQSSGSSGSSSSGSSSPSSSASHASSSTTSDSSRVVEFNLYTSFFMLTVLLFCIQ